MSKPDATIFFRLRSKTKYGKTCENLHKTNILRKEGNTLYINKKQNYRFLVHSLEQPAGSSKKLAKTEKKS